FVQHEINNKLKPHNPGPLADLFKKLSDLQALEADEETKDSSYQRIIRTSIITARSAPTHERVITTLENWGVSANETFFLGGMKKEHILNTLKPHMFFDDQKNHLQSKLGNIPMVHIPFGITNNGKT
ncbi:MAG: 5'-nucleotidase, partial [Ghiorsea sp.]|nr:5'-nucleotidase [Ghiorsea sp.]